MENQNIRKDFRVYNIASSCIFKKNNEKYGALSNMSSGFPILINGIQIQNSEALYQICKFPNDPDIQKIIIETKSPMIVKNLSRKYKKSCRPDWDSVKVKIMRWCLNIKLAQNFISFGSAIHETGLSDIVENSSKDDFWGAIPNSNQTQYIGKNALGRLLMDLRASFYSVNAYALLIVPPPEIENFLIYGNPVTVIDERENFLLRLKTYWASLMFNGGYTPIEYKNIRQDLLNISIEENDINKISKKPGSKKKNKKKVKELQPTLFPNK